MTHYLKDSREDFAAMESGAELISIGTIFFLPDFFSFYIECFFLIEINLQVILCPCIAYLSSFLLKLYGNIHLLKDVFILEKV